MGKASPVVQGGCPTGSTPGWEWKQMLPWASLSLETLATRPLTSA